jgi:hypothetical protein
VAKYKYSVGLIILDALDQHKFLACGLDSLFSGAFTGDCITFRPQKDLSLPIFSNLVNNQLVGFRISYDASNAESSTWKYCNICLDTLREQAVEVPMILDGRYAWNLNVSFYVCLFLISINLA